MTEQPTYTFSEFSLDPARRVLTRHGEVIDLNSKAFDVLLTLIENRGRVLPKDELLNKVWEGQFVEENNLAVQIFTLRKVFGETKNDNRFIVTVPRKGYKFVAEIENGSKEIAAAADVNGWNSAALNGAPLGSTAAEPVSRVPGILVGRRSVLAILGALLAAAIGIAMFSTFRGDAVVGRHAGNANIQTRIRQLTTRGKVGLTAISPNGEFYVYSIDEPGERKRSIWLAQVKGGKHIQLRPPDDNVVRGLAFSRDGERLYFTLASSDVSEGGLFEIPILGGVERKIASSPRGAFDLAPDGTRLAYYRRSKEVDAWALVVANLDGSLEREVATRPPDTEFRARGPAWSPDGSMIAVSAVVDPTVQREEILVVRLADGKTWQLTNRNWKAIHGIAWCPDGRNVISVGVDNLESLRHLWRIEYPSGQTSRLSTDTADYGAALSISEDGKSLIALQLTIESNIWIAPSTNLAEARQISFSSINGAFGWSGLEWSSNGGLVFDGGVERNRAIFIMTSSGDDVRQITSGGFYDHHPAVSPDGRSIVFCSDRSGRNEVWRASIDGAELRQITDGGGCSSPDVTPDGTSIVFVSNRGGRSAIWSVPVHGGDPIQLVKEESFDPKVSPDGRFIACALRPAQDSSTKLAILDRQSGSVIKLFEMPHTTNFNGGINWTPDGTAITVRDWANGIWKQNVTGGAPTRLDGLPAEKLYGYDWSPDGKTFAFSRGRAISDAVLITLD